jgi:hypothetical protein
MITGLDVTGSVYPHKYKGSSRQKGVKKELDIRCITKNICLMVKDQMATREGGSE